MVRNYIHTLLHVCNSPFTQGLRNFPFKVHGSCTFHNHDNVKQASRINQPFIQLFDILCHIVDIHVHGLPIPIGAISENLANVWVTFCLISLIKHKLSESLLNPVLYSNLNTLCTTKKTSLTPAKFDKQKIFWCLKNGQTFRRLLWLVRHYSVRDIDVQVQQLECNTVLCSQS